MTFLVTNNVWSQQISGSELLEKAINFHDPNRQWQNLIVQLTFAQENPEKGQYARIVSIDNSKGTFSFFQKDSEKTLDYSFENNNCKIKLNGSLSFTREEAEKYRLNCDRVKMYRDYYSYLYGLPMKLKDKGTILDPLVLSKEFQGQAYWVLKVTYDEAVGNDIWHFYFDKQTYALSGYRFYHDESANDGEYITLDGLVEFQGIKIPKTRKWYYNKDGKFLGTDDLIDAGPIK